MKDESYESPLSSRYASAEMSFIFSAKYKYSLWRKLWLSLAKAQKKLGLQITEQQINSLSAHLEDIDWESVQNYEKRFHHDVMAHIHAFGDKCPEAKGIIHLGATSCFVTDNGDLIQIKEALKLLRTKLVQIIRTLTVFANDYSKLACLGYTHLQPAQPTTVGKRACLWLQDFIMDLSDLENSLEKLAFLGAKGATGTQAAFLSLFDMSSSKVQEMDSLIAKDFGFERVLQISGQTYTRKQDIRILSVLCGIAASSHKIATDIRLLAHLKEMQEPFSETQIGSSAMPYKRNPMRSERICGLSRFLLSLNENPLYTASTQWLERTLDDSANRRLAIPEAFLCADAILNLVFHVLSGLKVYPKMIEKNLNEELPFMAIENLLMQAVKKGADRQTSHEVLRRHAVECAKKMQEEGSSNDLLERILQDPSLKLTKKEIQEQLDIKHFMGRAEEQVYKYLEEEVLPLLNKYANLSSYISKTEV